MAISFVAGSAYVDSNGTTIYFPIPAGSAAGDLVVLAAGTSDSGNVVTLPDLTQVYGQAVGTGYNAVGWKVLDAGDITAGTLAVDNTAGTNVRGCVVTYRGVDSVGTLGTATKRSGASTTIFAAGVALAAGDLAVVIRLEKSTGNNGPATSSPTVTQRQTYFSGGTASPSIVLAETTTTNQDVTFTDPVSSGNGVGMQLPLLAGSTPPAGPTVSVWDGTTEITGCTVSVWDGSTETAGVTIEEISS